MKQIVVAALAPQSQKDDGRYVIQGAIPTNTREIRPLQLENVSLNHAVDTSVNILENVVLPLQDNERYLCWTENGVDLAAPIPLRRNAVRVVDAYPHSYVIQTDLPHGVPAGWATPLVVAGIQLSAVWWTNYEVLNEYTLRLIVSADPDNEDGAASPTVLYSVSPGDPFVVFLAMGALPPLALAQLVSAVMTEASRTAFDYHYTVDLWPEYASIGISAAGREYEPASVHVQRPSFLTWSLGVGVGTAAVGPLPLSIASVWKSGLTTLTAPLNLSVASVGSVAPLLGSAINYALEDAGNMYYETVTTSGTVTIPAASRATPQMLALQLSVSPPSVLAVGASSVGSETRLSFATTSDEPVCLTFDDVLAALFSPPLHSLVLTRATSPVGAVCVRGQTGQREQPLLYNYEVASSENRVRISSTAATARLISAADDGAGTLTLSSLESNGFMPLDTMSAPAMLLATSFEGEEVMLVPDMTTTSGSLRVLNVLVPANKTLASLVGWRVQPVYGPRPAFTLIAAAGLGMARGTGEWLTSSVNPSALGTSERVVAVDALATLPSVVFLNVEWPPASATATASASLGGASGTINYLTPSTQTQHNYRTPARSLWQSSRHTAGFAVDPTDPSIARVMVDDTTHVLAGGGADGDASFDSDLVISFHAPSLAGGTRTWNNSGQTFYIRLALVTR